MRHRIVLGCGRIGLSALLVCALVPLLPPGGAAALIRDPMTIRVDATTGSDLTGDGTLAHPYETIEKAMSIAPISGDVVRIAQGTYYPPSTIEVPTGVQIIGAGLGLTRIWGVGGPSGPVFRFQGADANTRLEGVEVRGGGGTEGGAVQIIGAMESDAPMITACQFIDNGVSDNGGAMYIDKGMYSYCRPLIMSCEFNGNEAGESGGAIYVTFGANPFIMGCTFSNNGASGVRPAGGGAIFITGAYARITGCEIVDGGAPSGTGGGISITNPTGWVEIQRTLIAGNDADYGGGVALNSTSYMTYMENCRIEDNVSTSDAGGMRVYDASVDIDGCSFVGNHKVVDDQPGALSVLTGADVTVRSSLFHNNGSVNVPASPTGSLAITYSFVNEKVDGIGNIDAPDPGLTSVSDYIERLSPTSPCIDAGDPASTLETDFYSTLRPMDGPDADSVARVDMGAFEYGSTIGRLAGSDRWATSVAAIGPRYRESSVAILATGRNFPDALCAAGLAGAFHAPVLLTDTNTIPSAVRDALVFHETRWVIIVGGPSVVGTAVETQLRSMGIDVTRLAGADRYETSRVVADYMATMGPLLGHDLTQFCWVARGDLFPDALALAPLAALRDAPGPVLLTRPDSLPSTIKGALVAYDYEHALVAGSSVAVSEAVYGQIAAEVDDIDRAGGANRYETAAAIADWAMGADFTAGEFIGIATGENFPDALAGGAACGYERGLLLLTRKDTLHPSAAAFMRDNTDALHEIYVFGSNVVVSDNVVSQIRAIAP